MEIDWDAQPLGMVPDRILAEQLGVPDHTVTRARVSRGIDRYRKPEGPPPPKGMSRAEACARARAVRGERRARRQEALLAYLDGRTAKPEEIHAHLAEVLPGDYPWCLETLFRVLRDLVRDGKIRRPRRGHYTKVT